MKNKKTFIYILAFLIPCLLMLGIYAVAGIYPFGKKSLLTVDMAGQYVAFFTAYKNIFTEGISVFYSFSKTLGGNMFGLITYYLMSPFNLILLLFDKINITEAILLMNILKIGACGLTSYIYFDKTFKEKNIVKLVFSIVYALCAYNIVYSQNLLWLDGVIFLPLVFLGIDKLIKDKKPILFYLMLVITIVCNYYIGYMTCIGALAYFLYKLYLSNNYKLSWKENKHDIIYFFKYAFLAVGTTMIILLPSLFSLIVGKADAGLSEFIPKQTYPVIELISRFFLGAFTVKDLSGGCPNVYISLMMIVLVFVYFFNSKINSKEKKGTLFLILFFIISFVFYPVDVIWHTFQHPAGFPFRYSFIFDFVLLIIAFRCYQNIKGVDRKLFKKLIPAVIIITVIMDKLMYTTNMYYKIICSGILIIAYLLYLYYSKSQVIKKIFAVIIVIEMCINGILIVYNLDYQKRDEYIDFITEYGEVIENIKKHDNGIYRIEKDYSYSTNDPLLLNYNGISHFSSTYEGINNSLLGDYLGVFNRFYITNHTGSTPVTDSLFNIKYLLLNDESNYYKLFNNYDNKIYAYENIYSLPLGFMVNQNLKKLELEKLKPFVNQNQILKNMSGFDKDVFLENKKITTEFYNLKLKENDKIYIYNKANSTLPSSLIYTVKVEHSGGLYAYISSEYNKKIDILLNGEHIIDTSDQNAFRYNIIDLGYFEKGDVLELEIQLLENQIKFNDIVFYTFDLENFDKHINILQNNQYLNIDTFKGDYIKATIEVNNSEQMLYTSIPFDNGWTIKVDGKNQTPIKIFDSLIGLKLEEGNHTIELSYTPRGLYLGAVISLISIVLVVIMSRRKKGKCENN
ncbi:MAG: hypothetical protein E7165_04510 [Firmicutes bacterium]|nr:hypothetical protein [Bacillota bacterium]